MSEGVGCLANQVGFVDTQEHSDVAFLLQCHSISFGGQQIRFTINSEPVFGIIFFFLQEV